MNCTAATWKNTTGPYFRKPRLALGFPILLIWCSAVALGQNSGQLTDSPFSVRATHLLGFEGTKSNAQGTLSIQDNSLQFQKDGRPAVQVKIAFVQDVFLGGQSKQVGGVPMTLGKAAVPFGGGRVVSLFAHKKYDTLTLEYVDTNGALHGAIFQLNKGQGDLVRNELVAGGAHVSDSEGEPRQQSTSEVSNESK